MSEDGRLVGAVAALRELRRDDIPLMHASFADDPRMHAWMEVEPWRPATLEQKLAAYDRRSSAERADDATVVFAVQRRDDPGGTCVGRAILWDIQQHQRTAHVGLHLVPGARGEGLGRDVLDLLCRYAFVVRDLHRVQIETLSVNEPMRRTALALGFVREGVLRETAWVLGERVDEEVYGLLARDWRAVR